MAAALIIGAAEKLAIQRAKDYARKHPISWEAMKDFAIKDDRSEITLAEKKPGTPERSLEQRVEIPFGYEAIICVEEQPAGTFWHLSVSAPSPGRIPNQPAMAMIAEEFGMSFPPKAGKIWLEEFVPHHFAINVLELIEERPVATEVHQ